MRYTFVVLNRHGGKADEFIKLGARIDSGWVLPGGCTLVVYDNIVVTKPLELHSQDQILEWIEGLAISESRMKEAMNCKGPDGHIPWNPFEEQAWLSMSKDNAPQGTANSSANFAKTMDNLTTIAAPEASGPATVMQEILKHFNAELVDTNLKTAAAVDKPQMSGVPPIALMAIGAAMQDGVDKYGRFNWRVTGITRAVFYDAMQRHLLAWYTGESKAADSGVHHLAHLMASCAIILDAEFHDVVNEDGDPKGRRVTPEEQSFYKSK